MKKTSINIGNLNIKKVVAVLTSTFMLFSASGCSKSNKTAQPGNDTTTSITTEETTEVTTTTFTKLEYDGTYSKEMWNVFINNTWDDISNVIKSTDKEGFETAIYMLNIDNLKKNNSQLLIDYLTEGKGNNTNDDLNKIFKTLSEITTHNITIDNSKDYYSYTNLLSDKEDKDYIESLELLAKEMIDIESKYSNGTLTSKDLERAKVIFNLFNEYELGTGKINGKALAELSKGGIFAAEETAKVVGVHYRNLRNYNNTEYVSKEDYEKFVTSINSNRVLSLIQADWNRLSGAADVLNPPASTEEVVKIFNAMAEQRKLLYNEVSNLGVTQAEVDALHAITNIDFFVKDSNNQLAFNQLYPNGFDLNNNLYLAESAIKKIADYNATVTNTQNLYDYTHFIVDNQEGIITLFGLIPEVHKIYAPKSTEEANIVAQKLIDYAAYSDKATFNAEMVIGKEVKQIALDKNSLPVGINDLVNKIIYYTFDDNQDKLYEGFVRDAKGLTDGTKPISATQEQMSLMLDGICLEKNEVLDTYEIGHLERLESIDEKESNKVYTYTPSYGENLK